MYRLDGSLGYIGFMYCTLLYLQHNSQTIHLYFLVFQSYWMEYSLSLRYVLFGLGNSLSTNIHVSSILIHNAGSCE